MSDPNTDIFDITGKEEFFDKEGNFRLKGEEELKSLIERRQIKNKSISTHKCKNQEEMKHGRTSSRKNCLS
jgi:hypothetical protein